MRSASPARNKSFARATISRLRLSSYSIRHAAGMRLAADRVESAIREELEQRLTLEAELALAAERNEFELFYQPQVRLLESLSRFVGGLQLRRQSFAVLSRIQRHRFAPATLPSGSAR